MYNLSFFRSLPAKEEYKKLIFTKTVGSRDRRYCKNLIPSHTVHHFDWCYTVPYRVIKFIYRTVPLPHKVHGIPSREIPRSHCTRATPDRAQSNFSDLHEKVPIL
jgi:hypothetical protein